MAASPFVRVASELAWEALERRIGARRPRIVAVPGLIQKIYARDAAGNAACGIAFLESREARLAFRDSEPAKSIPAAYEAAEVRPEVYELLLPLFPEREPVAA